MTHVAPRCSPGSYGRGRRDFDRRGQVVDNGIQQTLNALVLEGRAAEHRRDPDRDGQPPNAGLEIVFGDRDPFDVLLEEFVILSGDALDQQGLPVYSSEKNISKMRRWI